MYEQREIFYIISGQPKINLICDNYNELKSYLSKKRFSDDEINIKNQINFTLLISSYEYEKSFFIYHKALSFFFKDNFEEPEFKVEYIEQVISFINNNKEYDKSSKKK